MHGVVASGCLSERTPRARCLTCARCAVTVLAMCHADAVALGLFELITANPEAKAIVANIYRVLFGPCTRRERGVCRGMLAVGSLLGCAAALAVRRGAGFLIVIAELQF